MCNTIVQRPRIPNQRRGLAATVILGAPRPEAHPSNARNYGRGGCRGDREKVRYPEDQPIAGLEEQYRLYKQSRNEVVAKTNG